MKFAQSIGKTLVHKNINTELRTVSMQLIYNNSTSKCMHGTNQTEAEYSRHGKRSQRASLSQIGPVVLEVGESTHIAPGCVNAPMLLSPKL